MAVTASQNTVAATEAVLVAAPADRSQRIVICNREASSAIYVGPKGLTTSTGFKIAAGESLGLTLGVGEALSFIGSGAGTAGAVQVLGCNL